MIIKLSKSQIKKKLLEATREKGTITYKGVPIGLSADISAKTFQARRQQDGTQNAKIKPINQNYYG